jgi:hypothetical protein
VSGDAGKWDHVRLQRAIQSIVAQAKLEEANEAAALHLLNMARAAAKAECARCCAQLREENPELFARLADEAIPPGAQAPGGD